MLGQDFTSDRLPLDRVAAVLGEFGVKDHGSDNVADAHGDSTHIHKVDAKFLADLSAYARRIQAQSGNPVSWFFWSWNANSRECLFVVVLHIATSCVSGWQLAASSWLGDGGGGDEGA